MSPFSILEMVDIDTFDFSANLVSDHFKRLRCIAIIGPGSCIGVVGSSVLSSGACKGGEALLGDNALARDFSLMGNCPDSLGWGVLASQAGILHFLARLFNREKHLHLCKIAYRFDLANTKTNCPTASPFSLPSLLFEVWPRHRRRKPVHQFFAVGDS